MTFDDYHDGTACIFLFRSDFKSEERAKHRSKTFEGIAEAMAEQWGAYNGK